MKPVLATGVINNIHSFAPFSFQKMIGLILATILLLLIAWKFIPQRKTEKKIPGLSRKDKVLGNLTDIAKAGNMQAFLRELHQQHGPLASFWYGDVFTVSLADTKYFKITEKMFDRHPALFKVKLIFWNSFH